MLVRLRGTVFHNFCETKRYPWNPSSVRSNVFCLLLTDYCHSAWSALEILFSLMIVRYINVLLIIIIIIICASCCFTKTINILTSDWCLCATAVVADRSKQIVVVVHLSSYSRWGRWITLRSRHRRMTLSVTLQCSSHDDAWHSHRATLPPPNLPMPPQPSPTIGSPLVPTRRSPCHRHLLSNRRTLQVGVS